MLVCGRRRPQLKRISLGCSNLMPLPTQAAWQADFLSVFGERQAPPFCPGCKRMGFFGPRKASGDRLYWLCKFCGLYQGIDEDPVQCIATVHSCFSWPTIAGAPYIWWVRPGEVKYECPWCKTVVYTQQVTVRRPADDDSHPWWQVPQDLTFEAASTFWHDHGQSRVYL